MVERALKVVVVVVDRELGIVRDSQRGPCSRVSKVVAPKLVEVAGHVVLGLSTGCYPVGAPVGEQPDGVVVGDGVHNVAPLCFHLLELGPIQQLFEPSIREVSVTERLGERVLIGAGSGRASEVCTFMAKGTGKLLRRDEGVVVLQYIIVTSTAPVPRHEGLTSKMAAFVLIVSSRFFTITWT